MGGTFVGLNRLGGGKAVQDRQADIHNDQIDVPAGCNLDRLGAVFRLEDREPDRFEIGGQDESQLVLVLDNENDSVVLSEHAAFPAGGSYRSEGERIRLRNVLGSVHLRRRGRRKSRRRPKPHCRCDAFGKCIECQETADRRFAAELRRREGDDDCDGDL